MSDSKRNGNSNSNSDITCDAPGDCAEAAEGEGALQPACIRQITITINSNGTVAIVIVIDR